MYDPAKQFFFIFKSEENAVKATEDFFSISSPLLT